MKVWQSILLGIAIAVAVACSFMVGRYVFPKQEGVSVKVKRDTVFKTDTFFRDNPVPVVKKILTTELVPVHDTLRVHDTLYISLPIEQKVYEDSLYRAVVSGFLASLDEIQIFSRTSTIYETVEVSKKRRITFGASVGVGAFYGITTKRFDVGPGIMGSVNINF